MQRRVGLWCMICAFAPAIAVAQFFPYPYGGFGGFYSPSTAAESYQRGFADVVRSTGEANLMNSVAAQNLEQARAMDIDNRLKWTRTYYQMRQENRAYRASKRSPRLTEEQIVRIAKQRLPNRLTAADFDPLTGQINWPLILREQQYNDYRDQLQKLLDQWAMGSQKSPTLYREIEQDTDDLIDLLKKNIDQYKPNDWIRAKKFVESLAYEVQFHTT